MKKCVESFFFFLEEKEENPGYMSGDIKRS